MKWGINLLQNILIVIIGISAGAFTACGVCAVLTTVSVITRIAWKTGTTKKIRVYENCILAGAVLSVYLYIYEPDLGINSVLSGGIIGFIGLFFGIFVGCLAVSLAEALDASTIMFRRINFTKNTKYVLLAVALGKFVGNLIFFLV